MEKQVEKRPRIFRVNWFRKDANGKFAWPGFGDNMRVLKWIVDRVRDRAPDPVKSPFGNMPRYQDLNWNGLDFSEDRFNSIMNIDRGEAVAEAKDQAELFARFGHHLPAELEKEREDLLRRLEETPPVWRLA